MGHNTKGLEREGTRGQARQGKDKKLSLFCFWKKEYNFLLPDCAHFQLLLYKEWQFGCTYENIRIVSSISALLYLDSVQLATEQEQFDHSGKTSCTLWCDSEVVIVLWIHNLFECDSFQQERRTNAWEITEKKKCRESWLKITVLILHSCGYHFSSEDSGKTLNHSLFSGKSFP